MKLVYFLFFCFCSVKSFYLEQKMIKSVRLWDNEQSLEVEFSNNDKILKTYLHIQDNYYMSLKHYSETGCKVEINHLGNAIGFINIDLDNKVGQTNFNNFKFSIQPKECLKDFTFNLKYRDNDYWYGGPIFFKQNWPNNEDFTLDEFVPLVTSDFSLQPFGSILQQTWINSKGYVINVDKSYNLAYKQHSKNVSLQIRNPLPNENFIKFDITLTDNVKEAAKYMFENYIEKPKKVPEFMKNPKIIWSSWAEYKTLINESSLLEFANNIHNYGLAELDTVFEIDDKWEKNYGDLQIDDEKFPNLDGFLKKIENFNYDLSIWIHPFINEPYFSTLTEKEKTYLIFNAKTKKPFLIKWWNGEGYAVDFSNEEACEWFFKRVNAVIKRANLKMIKFDAGEIGYVLKDQFSFKDEKANLTPNQYTKLYSDAIAKYIDIPNEVRSGYYSQSGSHITRLFDKDSNWSYDNGFKSFIPSCLTYSLNGYIYLLPDMIGGNVYKKDVLTKDLYIKWLSVNTFLPLIQFSIPPWNYDQETIDITKNFLKFYGDFIKPRYSKLAENSLNEFLPLIRPMWWIDPEDEKTWVIDSQFVIGDDLIVAPIVDQDTQSRSLYLPKGKWQFGNTSLTFEGPITINSLVELGQVPYFLKLN